MTVKITELPLAAAVAGSTIMYVIDPTGPTSERTTLESIAEVISPTASQSVKGIVTIGAGINVDVNGVISVPTVTTISGNAGTVTNGVYTTGSYADPTWITSLDASKVGLGSVTNESKATMFASPTFTGTVAGVTATMVGLGSVTNESKVTMFSSPTFTGTVAGVTATHVGLGNVTNESKATMFASPTFTGTVAGVTATMVGLGNVTNESKATMFSSPTFTEIPLAPTAIAGTNTTQVATTQFVRTEVSNLVNGAGPALDTLKELADALGSDANFSATISTALGLKAPLANPAFTGTPTGITATHVGLGNVTNESKATMFASPTFTGTVSGVTATHVGLGNVTNESKATMFASPAFTGTPTGITATMVGLGSVTNESKATMFSSPTFTGTVAGVTKAHVGLGSVDNTADANKSVSYAATAGGAPATDVYTWAKAATKPSYTATEVGLGSVTNESKATMFSSPTFTGTVSGVTKTHVGLGSVDNTADANKAVSSASTAGTATNHYGAGGSYIASSNSGTSYGSAIQVREAGLGGAQGGAIAYAPRLGFHWSGLVASSIVMESSGRIGIVNNPGTSYEAFVCGTLTASNFSGTSSGTNTGDQTIPTTLPASDVYAWAKAATKPSYTKSEVGLGSVDNTADSAKSVSYASTAGRAYPYRSDGGALNFYWSGQSGQPPWLWGGSDGSNMYVYNPSNFSVNYATSAGSAPASDVYAWAKAASKPSYTNSEVGLSNVGNYTVNQNVGTGNDVTHNTVTATAFYYSSDATLKTNISSITNYWETLDALRPVSFDWISSGKKDLGLLAQDVQSVMPESVTTTDAGTLAISSSGIIANLVAAVKDLKQQVEELTKQLKG